MLSFMLCLCIDKTSGGFGRVIHRQHKLELFLFSTSMVSEVNSEEEGNGSYFSAQCLVTVIFPFTACNSGSSNLICWVLLNIHYTCILKLAIVWHFR